MGAALLLFLTAAVVLPSTGTAAEVTVTLLDPVPDLLSGDAVSANADDLSQKGRAVQGVSADGVAQLVLRISGNKTKVGDRFILTLLNAQGTVTKNVEEDGSLEEPGKTDFNRNSVTVRAVQTKGGVFAFALYRAPRDFPRAAGVDNNAAQRNVTVNVVFANALPPVKQPIVIIRPLVILVHGLWGDPASWNDFAPLNGRPADPRFAVKRADYDIRVRLFGSTPRYNNLNIMSSNGLGLEYNAKYSVLPEFINFIKQFKNGDNPPKIPVAAVQADVVAHSMGGVVTLTMPLIPEFFSSQTFSKGLVHKLITIATPHFGSPLAIALLDDKNKCIRQQFATYGLAPIESATVQLAAGLMNVSGGVGDLRGDGVGGALSAALTRIQAGGKPLPTSMIGGVSTADNLANLSRPAPVFNQETNGALVLRATCAAEAGMQDTLAGRITPERWSLVFNNQDHDSIVTLRSQQAARTGPLFSRVVHSQGLVFTVVGLVRTAGLGFTGPCELSPCRAADSGIAMQVVNLLNIPVTNGDAFSPVP
jgi:pimeloyl-ACP methyl ester carboxylesterase